MASVKGRLFAAMLLGLQDLDAEGFFGTGELRERVTLLCSITDSADGAWLEEESTRRLNPPPVYQAFFERWKTNSAVAARFAKHLAEPGEVYQAFSAHLASGR